MTVGNAFYLPSPSAGRESVFNTNNDWFDLSAGQSYDFGINFASTSVGGFWGLLGHRPDLYEVGWGWLRRPWAVWSRPLVADPIGTVLVARVYDTMSSA